MTLRWCLLIFIMFSTVPAPIIQLSPGGSRSVYYSGEDLNVTCISSVVGAVFTWRAVNITTQQPLIIPNTTVSSGSNTSVLILRPIRVSDHVLVDFICAVAFPENMIQNIIGSLFPILVVIRGINNFLLQNNCFDSSSIIECVIVFQCKYSTGYQWIQLLHCTVWRNI